ncbi:hypothetical protein [Haloarcula amylovorans]|uniref:hypothetical protein n=1 Tax=Haloarcula amylovorans TaxID=2562280 RepID=UPI0010763D04|nr:hypothetical protein [Halomicroarcula amylolytica]
MSAYSHGVSQSTSTKVRTLYEQEIETMEIVLEADRFCIDDVPVDDITYQRVIRKLSSWGAIERNGKKSKADRDADNAIPFWSLKDGVRERLEEYRSNHERFESCGHRAHIHHNDRGGYGCQYCNELRDIDRETVEKKVFGQ